MIEYHDTLNPKLWEGKTLKSDIKEKLLEIYETFKQQLIEKEIPIEVIDVLLLGSNAAYNYTNMSDIDLHIVVDFSDIPLNDILTQIFYNSEKSKFNDNYDIKIKGLSVEVYIEDINAGTMSNGIYSLLQDKWIQYPTYNPPKDINYEDLLNKYRIKIKEVINSESADKIKKLLDDIKMLRKIALMQNGEFSKGNLCFKELRNDGSIQQLHDKLAELVSKELSLEKVGVNI